MNTLLRGWLSDSRRPSDVTCSVLCHTEVSDTLNIHLLFNQHLKNAAAGLIDILTSLVIKKKIKKNQTFHNKREEFV